MAMTIRIRGVPEALHQRLQLLATQSGVSVSDYVLAALSRGASGPTADRPTADEMKARLLSRQPVVLDRPIAELIRSGR